jgi:hypothetical protein
MAQIEPNKLSITQGSGSRSGLQAIEVLVSTAKTATDGDG